MPLLRNHLLEVDISSMGAELQSVFNKETGIQYLWNGNPQYWAKRSPVLFPIVGELKNNSYTYNGQSYRMSRHGFARDMTFTVSDHQEHSVTLSIVSTDETLAAYPFEFRFSIQYTIDEDRLYVVYYVENKGDSNMYFSVGGHPAFNVPLVKNTDFDDYYLEFSQVENAKRYLLSPEGLIETTPVDYFHNAERLPLKRELFYNDALVFKDLQSASIELKSDKTEHGLIFYFDTFPYLGLWNKKDADFLCIEPWMGIADSTNASGDITKKEGINELEPGETFECQWSIEVY